MQQFNTTANSSDYEWIISSIAIEPANMNWALLIEDMRSREIPIGKQAEMLNTSYSTLQRYWQGSEPGFSTGHAILILHSKICGINITQQRLRRFSSSQ